MLKKLLLSTTIFCLAGFAARAEVDDVGLWLGAGVNHQVTRRMSVSLGAQLRLDRNASRINRWLIQPSVDYTLTRKLKVGLAYRYISVNEFEFYSSRHRLIFDAVWKEKLSKRFTILLRERFQGQVEQINSSETGYIPTYYWRNRVTLKYNTESKWQPYASFEFYYLLDDSEEGEQEMRFRRFRYEAGVDYEFDLRHSVNPFVLLNSFRNNESKRLVFGITYGYSF